MKEGWCSISPLICRSEEKEGGWASVGFSGEHLGGINSVSELNEDVRVSNALNSGCKCAKWVLKGSIRTKDEVAQGDTGD